MKKPYSFVRLSEYVGDDKNQIAQMISLFLDTIPDDVNKIEEYGDKGNWQKVNKIAHRIKPSFEVFEMEEILTDIREIERLAHDNDKDGELIHLIKVLVKKFKEIVLLLKTEMIQ